MEYAECGSLYKVLHQAKPQPVYNAGEYNDEGPRVTSSWYIEHNDHRPCRELGAAVCQGCGLPTQPQT